MPHDKNCLEIRFVGRDFSAADDVRCRYTLEGLAGDGWRWTDRRSVFYFRIPERGESHLGAAPQGRPPQEC